MTGADVPVPEFEFQPLTTLIALSWGAAQIELIFPELIIFHDPDLSMKIAH